MALNIQATEGGYFLVSATAVPEPAEWAMIFGGIALGLTVYRRRKQSEISNQKTTKKRLMQWGQIAYLWQKVIIVQID